MDRSKRLPKRVFVGDATKRWSLSMPPSLANFQCRLRKVYKLHPTEPLEIWLHPIAHAASPAFGREKIVTESDYRCIIDDDVVVIVVGGRAVEPDKALADEFFSQTTYQSDFVAKTLKHREPCYAEPKFERARSDLVVPDRYVTTYGRDYVEKAVARKPREPYVPADRESVKLDATTVYQRDFVPKSLDATDRTAPEPELLRDWRPSRSPARSSLKASVSRSDFIAYGVAAREAPSFKPPAEVPEGAKWLPTEYEAKYLGAAGEVRPQRTRPPTWSENDIAPPPEMCLTTYTRDFVPHSLHGAQRLNVDPYDFSIAGAELSAVSNVSNRFGGLSPSD